MQFRLLTYNIHKGIGGVDRKYRPERIAETIAHYEADVVLMQEVDDGVPRSSRHRQVDWLAERLGFQHRAFQANVRLKQGAYGNAILSRFPLTEVEDVELTVRLKKRRRALLVDVALPGASRLRLANLHLGLAGFERKIQLLRLLGHPTVGQTASQPAAGGLIIAGDFNDVWGGLGKKLLQPQGFQCATGRAKTFPAARPVRALDRVFYRGPLSAVGGFCGHTKLARQASDHLPLIVDFELPDANQ